MKILFRGQLMLLMTIIIKSIWKYIFSTNTDTPISASTCAHLHGVDGRLCCGSSQRSSQEPLVGLDLPWFTGQHLLILMEHSDKGALHQNYISMWGSTNSDKKAVYVNSKQLYLKLHLEGSSSSELCITKPELHTVFSFKGSEIPSRRP